MVYFITKYFNSIYSNCVILCINCILFYCTCFVHCCAVMHSVGRLTEVRKSQLNSHVNQTIDTCLMVASSIDHQFKIFLLIWTRIDFIALFFFSPLPVEGLGVGGVLFPYKSTLPVISTISWHSLSPNIL